MAIVVGGGSYWRLVPEIIAVVDKGRDVRVFTFLTRGNLLILFFNDFCCGLYHDTLTSGTDFLASPILYNSNRMWTNMHRLQIHLPLFQKAFVLLLRQVFGLAE